MAAYYNEIDRYKCDWLQNNMDAGLITPGVIDDRSIADIDGADLRNYERVHFFAGVGLWDYALDLAGWPADRAVCTGSCPCPPFSSAGKKKACSGCGGTNPVPCPVRTGFFICCICGHAWDADQRHLWPEFWRVIRDARFDVVFGEQVSSEDGRTWLDIVRASLEIMDYRLGYQDSCSSGIGAPNIRQRLYWVADTAHGDGWSGERAAQEGIGPSELRRRRSAGGRVDGWLADADGGLTGGRCIQRGGEHRLQPQDGGTGDVGDAARGGFREFGDASRLGRGGHADGAGIAERMGFAASGGPPRLGAESEHGITSSTGAHPSKLAEPNGRPRPLNGFWRDADWLCCTDGKWRPVRPGAFVLAAGDSGRVRIHRTIEGEEREHVYSRTGALRGFGDAINVEVAAEFIRAYIDCERVRS